MKIFKYKITVLLLLNFLIFGNTIRAQQYKPNTEIGILLGASYYLGDLNTVHFNQSSPAAGLVIRKNIDKRFAYKGEIMYVNLRSDERGSDDTIAASRGLHFRSPVYELSGQVEFNFLPYDPGNPLYTWTPFVYGGVSIFNFNPQAENAATNGEWVDLQEMGTEGQGSTTFPDRKKYSLIQFSAALGGGVKIAVSNSFNIIIEYSTRKTFTDYLDDVSTTYPGGDLADMTPEAISKSDPSGTHLKDEQRGNADKNDWYSFAGITLSFKLANKTKGCDY
jgi:opacity protein-like surface antigen